MKQIIWTSDYLLDDKARKEYENSQRYLLDDDDYKVSDAEWTEVTNDNLTDERMNLDKQIEGVCHSICRPRFMERQTARVQDTRT